MQYSLLNVYVKIHPRTKFLKLYRLTKLLFIFWGKICMTKSPDSLLHNIRDNLSIVVKILPLTLRARELAHHGIM